MAGSSLAPGGSGTTPSMNDALSPVAAPLLMPRGAADKAKLVLGTMNLGKRTDAAASARILGRAIERGIVLLDTANVYNDVESERIVGRAIQSCRDSVMIATKVGL